MGGLTAKPPSPPQIVEQPVIEPAVDTERQERIASVERRRRGRSSTIKTSERGFMGMTSIKPTKELLGE